MTETLETGDILLFTSESTGIMGIFSSLIKWATHSNYTHVAMVLKDPDFVTPPLKGLYVWQSGWEGRPDPQDNKLKLGVQITPLQQILDDYKDGHVFYRKPNSYEAFTNENLKKIHKTVYEKPYDIILSDWIKAFIQKDDTPQKTDRFWCSALVAYIYTICGILDEKTDWAIVRPCDFGLSSEHLIFRNNYFLENSEKKIQ